MAKQAYIITGLGYGDEGKGSIVDWLTVQHNVHTVIRTGGPQALHRVVTSDGREHVFSQFGSGTLRGARTHLSRQILTAPSALLREGRVLHTLCGRDVFTGVTIHRDSLLVTPVQARVRELLRGAARRGSVGVGVGEAVRDAEVLGELALYAGDLASPHLPEILSALWQYKRSQYESYADRSSGLPEPIGTAVRNQLTLIADENLLQQTIGEFTEIARRVRIVDDEYVTENILTPGGTIICEGPQGVLLDRVHGFYPYTTKIRSVPNTALELLATGGYTGQIHSLGILRSYATRHGHGPFVTEDSNLTHELPDAKNHNDVWQGNFRVGHFDAVASRYAATVCGPGTFDGQVLTCLDRTSQLDTWSVCTEYQHKNTNTYWQADNLIRENSTSPKELSMKLGEYWPVLQHIDQQQSSEQTNQTRQIETIATLVGIPVYAVSVGATEKDKFLYKT